MSSGDQPGFFVAFLRSIFGFRKTTLSLLVLLSYFASVLITIYYERQALLVPSSEPPILASSWLDLEMITRLPHPYGSHANDDVHNYILGRVQHLSKTQTFILYDDDYGSRSIFKQIDVFNSNNEANRIIYFESGNILVKIEGKDKSLEGILISAHYDSVPSSYGVTDDGMGVASMLGILEYYSSTGEQPLRNIVFNFNNNEEFGLLGASVFFDHKWSKLVKYFINLEGTGAGGRSILFRATDNGIASYYNSVRSPFGNSLYQQGFQSGLIRSETDYKIYLENGLRGVDIAFYKPRNLYHTKFDNIQGSSKGSLWHMLSNSLDLLITLSNTEELNTDTSPSAFFDILGLKFFSISVDRLFILNMILLTILPVSSIILLLIVVRRKTWFVSFGQGWLRFPISLVASVLGTLSVTNIISSINPLILGSDWFSVLICSTCVFILINYLIINFFSWWMPVHDQKLIIFLQLSFLLWVLLIISTMRQHTAGLSGEYALSLVYLMSAISTIFGLLALIFKPKPTWKNISSHKSYGSIPSTTKDNSPLEESSRIITDQLPDENATAITSHRDPSDQSGEEEPLLPEVLDLRESGIEGSLSDNHLEVEDTLETINKKLKVSALKSFQYDWSIQFLIFVPVTIFIVYNLGDLLMQGLNYTGQEGNKLVASSFKLLSYFAILLGLPLLPFIHKLNFFLFLVVLCGSMIAGVITLSQSPVNSDSPLKVSFVQSIDLTTNLTQSRGTLYGRAEYVEKIVSQLPSVVESGLLPNCSTYLDGRGSCEFDALRPWLVDGGVEENEFANYLKVEVVQNDNNGTSNGSKPSPYAPLSAELKIWAPDNRVCVVDFNTTKYSSLKKALDKTLVSPVKSLKIYHDGDQYSILPNISSTNFKTLGMESQLISENDVNIRIPSGASYDPIENVHRFKMMKGIDNVELHKVNFSAPFYHIGLEWMPNFEFFSGNDDDDDNEFEVGGDNLGISVSCYWGEYEKESILIDDKGTTLIRRKLPAFDELLHYAPNYVSVSNSQRGLLVTKNYVEL